MVDFIRKLFKKEEKEEIFRILYSDIPRWLDEEEVLVHSVLRVDTADNCANIHQSMDRLQKEVDNLRHVQIGDATPPKLRRAVETSLPTFINAMEISLRRQISDNPVECYEETVEALKSCTKNMNRQGKYLAAVFPEEMKELKSIIGSIGREINEMNTAMQQANESMKTIHDARDAYTALDRLSNEYWTKEQQWKALWKQVEKDEKRMKELRQAIDEIEADPEFRALLQVRTAMEGHEEEKNKVATEYSLLANTASSVLKRAEHAADRREERELAVACANLRSVMEDPNDEGKTAMFRALADLHPRIVLLQEQGDISFKNKEEEQLFADGESLISAFRSLCSRYEKVTDQLADDRSRLENADILRRREDLGRRLERLSSKHGNLVNEFSDGEDALQNLKEQVPALREDLEAKTTLLKEQGVEISFEGAHLPE